MIEGEGKTLTYILYIYNIIIKNSVRDMSKKIDIFDTISPYFIWRPLRAHTMNDIHIDLKRKVLA